MISAGAACRSRRRRRRLASGDPANGVTIDNPTGMTVKIVYEAPDGGTEPLAELAPGRPHRHRLDLCRSATACAAPAGWSRWTRTAPSSTSCTWSVATGPG